MEAKTKFMYSVESKEVDVALKSSLTKLTVEQFVGITGFEIDDVMFSEFWQVAVNKFQRMHVHALLLEWLGYEGEPRSRKLNFIAYLKRNSFPYEELSFDDDRIIEYASAQEELRQVTNNNIKRAKWIVMDCDDFKEAIMGLSTKRGNAIRRYYMRVEKLLKLYVEYDNRFETRRLETEKSKLESEKTSLQDKLDKVLVKLDNVMTQNNEQAQTLKEQTQKIDELKEQNYELMDQNDEILGNLEVVQDKLDVAVEDRVPKTVALYKRERFVLIKKNDDNERIQHYVIRGQQDYCNGRLQTFRHKYPNMQTLIDIEDQPNPVNLFNRFKERYSRPNQQPRFRVSGNHVSLGRHSESTLIGLFHSLNAEKKRVELNE